MSLLGRSDTTERTGYEPLQIDESLAVTLAGSAASGALVIRPNEDNGGIEAMSEVLESLHTVETASSRFRRTTRNVSPAHFFEMKYAAPSPESERVVTLQYLPGEGMAGTFTRQLQTRYPESQLETTDPQFLHAEAGQYVAGATLGLRRYTLLPIKNVDLPGFRSDPTGSILQEMVGAQRDGIADADAVVQIGFKPAMRDWIQGVPDGHGPADSNDPAINGTPSLTDLSRNLQQPTYEKRWRLFTRETVEVPPTTVDKKVATLLEDQQGSKGWRLCLRVFALSDDPTVAVNRASKVAGQFRNFYESASEQTFITEPLDRTALLDVLTRGSRREYTDRGIVKSHREVAGLVNVPEAQFVATNKLRWSLTSPGDGIPPGTPRADWEGLGIDPATATTEQKQVALLDADDGVTWYGLGERHGVEAGINYEHVTNPHKFVHGQSGVGKTTFLAADASQQFHRPGGGLRLDPTGDDTDDILAEWPTDRPAEDLIYMDLSGEFDRIPRFNFLEIPDYLDPDTRQFNEFVEKLAEDILSMVGVAGGDDEYIGALMKRVLKTVVRAMMQAGMTATLDDVAAVCSSSEGLERLADNLPEDRVDIITRIRDRIRSLAERNNTDLDPLAGRLDEWTLNPNVRELICARDPTFSITDAVADGREIVVRMSDSGSETVKHMVGTALITRTYFAQRFHRPDAPFELVVDEAQSILTSASDIENIMDQGRKFGYRVTIACQRPATQLGENVRAAVLGNARTTISYDSGRGDEARAVVGQHRNVDVEDLTSLSPFTFYMNTETADRESTHSYKVAAFRVPREARLMAAEQAGDDPDEKRVDINTRIETLKTQSLDRYGVTRDKIGDDHSPFDVSVQSESETESFEMDERTERLATQAVYDTAIRQGDPEGYVPLPQALPALRSRLDWDGDADEAWREVIQSVDAIEARGSDPTELRVPNPRTNIATVGTNQSAGGSGHAMLLWDAYAPLTQAGLDVTISEASGQDPDALATPIDDPAEPELVEALLGGYDEARVEAESSTVSKPGATVRHILQAHAEGRACIVLCRPETADAVRETIETDPPLCRSGHDVSGEIRYYNSPRGLRIGSSPMARPGGHENVWVCEAGGSIVLRDERETEWARFEDADAVFTDADAYPGGGRTVKRPVIPERVLGGESPTTTIVVVPEGADGLADLAIGGYPTGTDTVGLCGVTPAALDVPNRAEPLYEFLRAEVDGTVTKSDVIDLIEEHGLGISQPSVYRYMNDLEDAGVIIRVENSVQRNASFSIR